MPMKIIHPKSIVTFLLFTITSLANAGEMALDNNSCGSSRAVRSGDKLTVKLPGNPTTGYNWYPVSVPDMLKQQGAPSHKPDSSLIGAGGETSFSFLATGTGSGKLELAYRRAWEKDRPALKTCAIQITSSAPQSCPSPGQTPASYVSPDGKRMVACFVKSPASVFVTLPDGRSVSLPVAISASGARYSSGKQTFWEHQGTGRFFIDDKPVFEGRVEQGGEYKPGVSSTVLIDTDVTSSGQKITYPCTDKGRITALRVEIAPGTETGWHKHTIPVYAYMLSGELEVELKDGNKKQFKAGEVIIEVFNTFHNGRNSGSQPAVLIVFYTGIKGVPNVVKMEQPQ